MGKILRRCSLCNQFHAAYLVNDPVRGKLYLCKTCWDRRQKQKPAGQGGTSSP